MEAPLLVNMDQVLQEFLWIVNDPLAVPSFHAQPARSLPPEAKAAGADGGGQPAPPRIRLALPDGRQRRAAPGDRAPRGGLRRDAAPTRSSSPTAGWKPLYLALRSVAAAGRHHRAGSPTYFHLLQVIESLGIRALEIPSHPRDGISLEALEARHARGGAVKACVLLPNFPSPMGSLMPVERKRAGATRMAERRITLIEATSTASSASANSARRCSRASMPGRRHPLSAFTKTVAPATTHRLGGAGRHFLKTQALKFRTSVACRW